MLMLIMKRYSGEECVFVVNTENFFYPDRYNGFIVVVGYNRGWWLLLKHGAEVVLK